MPKKILNWLAQIASVAQFYKKASKTARPILARQNPASSA